ncbi:type IV pilus assembly protein PilM [Denitrovibrio acetiphilus DSM 12809]|uniref:Type IV pilus assembly protein PilM n=1 Tax=Denitrovibrio acetiphilus (strain DSM 12809 / NBRC 114555 / N2460) TaxID=522772 RepID=D4H2M3_DENA2|nr:pilus assembly protein PilM [Denitrovibrio acetiphilus]ADD67084.1 type IV pilus assembly protein PilM [Denitrovibrio acetiphilus DSM 12809]
MSKLLTGVDIGASNIKIVGLKEKKDSFVVSSINILPTPAGAFSGGTVADTDVLAKSLSECVKKCRGAEKDIALSLKGADVVVKRIALPWNGKGHFTEQFLWSAEQYIGMSSERASFDAQLLHYDRETQTADAVLAAASKVKVADMLDLASQSGLNPVVLDIESLALVNLVTFFKGPQKHINAIIDIGHDEVRVIFYENGHVDMVKTIRKGGRFMAEDLASDLAIDPAQAEEMIRNNATMKNDADAQAAAAAYGNNLGAEIETTVDVYIQERGKEPVDFFACGAMAYVADVVESIESSMGAAVAHVDPFKYIELPASMRSLVDGCGSGTFALACGLAMRKA